MFHRLLVPLDGSLVAETALHLAVRLARATQASIEVVRVIAPVASFNFVPELAPLQAQAEVEAEDEAQTYLQDLTHRKEWGDVVFHPQVIHGPIAASILAAVTTTRADLTILCRHHVQSALWPVGRVAEKVARHAPTPVLLVDGEGPPLPDQEIRVLIPLDTSPLAEMALPFATQLVEALTTPAQATVHLLHVFEAWVGADVLAAVLVDELPAKSNSQIAMIRTIQQYLRQQAEACAQGTALHTSWSINYDADEAQTILEVAETGRDTHGIVVGQPFALIVMASHGRGGWERWALGSIAERVMQNTHLPLLIVHAPPQRP